MDYTKDELQQMVFMLGSRKELGTYLGLDSRQLRDLWVKNELVTPVEWLRNQAPYAQMFLLATHGSYKALGAHLGMSEASAKRIIQPDVISGTLQTEDEIRRLLSRYKSVRLSARMLGQRESQFRFHCKTHNIDLATCIDYATGDHANAKGRRSELEFARIRGDNIVRDLNQEVGSQADYDFDDKEYGRVNVKSSRCHRYKAKSRGDSPYFWKISCRGIEKCDTVVMLCYDRQMKTLIGWAIKKPGEMSGKSITLLERDISSVPISPVG